MKKHIGKYISIREKPNGKIFSGFLIVYSKHWILLQYNEYDTYTLDGYILIPYSKHSQYKRDADEKFIEKVLHSKGIFPSKDPIKKGTSLQEILTQITMQFCVCSLVYNKAGDFYMGRCVSIGKKTIVLHELDRDARWDKHIRIDIDHMHAIQFADDYTQSLLQYNMIKDSKK